ncbi:MAG: hypothetical protein KDB79_16315 [Acidobacteria bacterium]|nr:hypothetical protein [Acidobacteriota bacterium]
MKKILYTKIVLVVLLVFSASGVFSQTNVSGETIAPGELAEDHQHPPGFMSDGCTAFPDGNYRECCEAHDLDYFRGGSFSERRASDKRLYTCVKAKGGWKNKMLAPMMYLGVRVFGTAWLPTKFRWGFGKKITKRLKAESKTKKKPETDNVPGKGNGSEDKPQPNKDQEN